MLSPKDMMRLEDEKYPEDEIVTLIDDSIRYNFEKYPYQFANLDKIIPLRIRNKIAAKYARCGWKYVYHIAGDEKADSFDRTYFYFSNEPVEDYYVNKFYLVQKSEVNMNEFAIYKGDSLVESISLDGE